MQIRLLSRPNFKTFISKQAKRMQNEFLSRPLCTYNEESLVVSDHESLEQTQPLEQSTEAPQEDIAAEFETSFKTLHINGIRVSG